MEAQERVGELRQTPLDTDSDPHHFLQNCRQRSFPALGQVPKCSGLLRATLLSGIALSKMSLFSATLAQSLPDTVS